MNQNDLEMTMWLVKPDERSPKSIVELEDHEHDPKVTSSIPKTSWMQRL